MSYLTEKILNDSFLENSEIINYKNIILLQEHGTPTDYEYLFKNIDKCHKSFFNHITSQYDFLTCNYRKMEDYQRVQFSKNTSIYTNKKSNSKKLVIAFCGRAHVLFGPIAQVLQLFSSSKFDVLVLRDYKKLGYTSGIEGLSPRTATCPP